MKSLKPFIQSFAHLNSVAPARETNDALNKHTGGHPKLSIELKVSKFLHVRV